MQFILTYIHSKHLVTSVLLSAYLLGSFQFSLCEFVHSAAHLFDNVHTYASHQNQEEEAAHQHDLLDLSAKVMEQSSSDEAPAKTTFSFDKTPQIASTFFDEAVLFDTILFKNSFPEITWISLSFPRLIIAPPQF